MASTIMKPTDPTENFEGKVHYGEKHSGPRLEKYFWLVLVTVVVGIGLTVFITFGLR